MTDAARRPERRPVHPFFSSGPCAKRPGWSPEVLRNAAVARSHRSDAGRAKLRAAIAETRALLEIPDGYRIAIVPASDTGAVEMALWSMLGARGVDLLAWESFGEGWVTDVRAQLRLEDARILRADYGALPDLGAVDPDHDVVFTWNGTTAGVRVPDGDWIADDRQGLTICDATSAVFAMALPWPKLDVAAFSWQKVLGGEAGHGMLILSPRAAERLESYVPPWPLPKIFRMTKGGKINEALFKGDTINTPSLLCVEDYLDALAWARDAGGLPELIRRSAGNLAAIADWVAESDWADFLAVDPRTRSSTSICLKIAGPAAKGLSEEDRAALPTAIARRLAAEGVAFDIEGYRDAPPGLRIWGGSTVERADIEALLPWLDWAFAAECTEAVAG